MEKYGVSKESLRESLRKAYSDLMLRKKQQLTKEASVQFDREIEAVKEKLESLDTEENV